MAGWEHKSGKQHERAADSQMGRRIAHELMLEQHFMVQLGGLQHELRYKNPVIFRVARITLQTRLEDLGDDAWQIAVQHESGSKRLASTAAEGNLVAQSTASPAAAAAASTDAPGGAESSNSPLARHSERQWYNMLPQKLFDGVAIDCLVTAATPLGYGSYGAVQAAALVRDPSQPVAMKVLKTKQDALAETVQAKGLRRTRRPQNMKNLKE